MTLRGQSYYQLLVDTSIAYLYKHHVNSQTLKKKQFLKEKFMRNCYDGLFSVAQHK